MINVSVFPQPKPPAVLKARDIDLTVPDDGYKYVQVKHDYEFFGYPRQQDWRIKYAIPAILNEVRLAAPNIERIPLPYRGRTYDYVTLSREWQFFLFDLFKWSVTPSTPMGKHEGTYKNASNPTMTFDRYTPGSLLWYYSEMIQDARSHTDAEPVEEGFQDFVTGRHAGKKPYSWMCKTTTGNILRVLKDMGKYWLVEAMDLSKAPPPIADIANKPHLLHWATQQDMVKRPDGTYVVSRYPQANAVHRLVGLPDTGTPIPNVSLGGDYLVLKTRTKVVAAGSKWSPYNPAK